jgi:hypothetical protein
LWITLAIGLVRTFLDHQKVTQEVADAGFGSGFVYFVTIFTLGFMALQIYLLGAGKNWARWLFVILFAIGIPSSANQLITSFANAPLSSSIGVIQALAQIYACVLLFTPTSRAWFKNTAK